MLQFARTVPGCGSTDNKKLCTFILPGFIIIREEFFMSLERRMCLECGKIFLGNKNKNFCNQSCRSKYISRRRCLKIKNKNIQTYLEVSKRNIHYVVSKEKYWMGKTKDGCYYKRELDIQYGELLICDYCGRKYYSYKHTNDNKKHFCCHECYTNNKITRKTKICLNCKKEFLVDVDDVFSQFCCNECNNEFNENIKNNKLPALLNLMESQCINCWQTYFTITNHSVNYCSLKCKNEFALKKNTKESRCIECGKKFFTHHNGKFCSQLCEGRYHFKRFGLLKKMRPKNNGMLGKKRLLSSREKQSKSMMKLIREGKFNTNSYIQGHYKIIPHFVRSTWEANFALILLFLKRDYRFEAKSFFIKKNCRYMPDFYDVKRNIFYEIKGRWIDDAKEKMNMFQKMHSNVKIHVIDRDKYVRIYKYFAKKILLIESFPNYKIDKTLKLMSRDDFKNMKITKEEHEIMYGKINDNAYKKWDKEFDKRLGLI